MNLKDLRISSGMTQKDMAKILGVSQSNYSKYEMGKTKLDSEHLIKLSQYFKISIDYILNNSAKLNYINKDLLTDNKRKAIDIIINLNEEQCEQFLHYLIGFENGKDYQLQQILKLQK